jgi:hypothetical protein
MKQRMTHRLWITSITLVALCSFLAGSSLACVHNGVETLLRAEDCCQRHCQHAMVGEAAADCCRSHHTEASQALPPSAAAKTFVATAPLLPMALLAPSVFHDAGQLWTHWSMTKHPPPFLQLYTLHCTLQI